MRRLPLLLVPLLLAACGATHRTEAAAPSFRVHRYGTGPARAWVYTPSSRPKLIVLFVHGLGNTRETTPYYHRPWL